MATPFSTPRGLKAPLPRVLLLLSAPALAALIAGCAGSQTRRVPDVPGAESRVLPYRTGGVVGAEARGALQLSFGKAAARLLDWRNLLLAQSGTVAVSEFPPQGSLDPRIEKAAEEAGFPITKLIEIRKAWLENRRSLFPKTTALLKTVREAEDLGAPLAEENGGGKVRASILSAFKGDKRTLIALCEIRDRKSPTEAALAELDYFVSESYKSGFTLYHLREDPEKGAVLTVRIILWIPQVEGFLGSLVPRSVASSRLREAAERLWRETAAYLSE